MSEPTPRPAERQRIGERIERAASRHVDVEGQISEAEQLELAEQATSEVERRTSRKKLVRRIVWALLLGVSLMLVAPAMVSLASSWDEVQGIAPGYLIGMALLQLSSLACLALLQKQTILGAPWRTIVTSQLAGNAMAKIAPGGGAVGATLQYRMLARVGVPRGATIGGLTTANLLTFAVVLAMPVAALPAIIRGLVPHDLLAAAISGVAVFALLGVVGAACLASDRPLQVIARGIQGVRNRLKPSRATSSAALATVLLTQRDQILRTLGRRWHLALGATLGRWALDYASLVLALAAIGSTPRPALILLAFCAAQLLAQIPITPGGLGFVEAGLTATLTLAGVGAANAAVATFAYRLFAYWGALPVGLIAFLVERRFVTRGAPPDVTVAP